jgi:hypothetical protein
MVLQQILVAAKLLSLIASLVIALGPMTSVAKCCCFGEQIRQWIGSTAQVDRCCAPPMARDPISAEPVALQQAERSCCQTLTTKLPAADMRQGASACDSSIVDTRACQCERAWDAGQFLAFRAQPKSEDSPRPNAQFAVGIVSLAPPPGSVLTRNVSARSVPFLSAQDRCVLLCRWLN